MTLEILAVQGIPEVVAGDSLAALIVTHAPELRDGDVLVVTSKVVSKAEGQIVDVDRELAIDADVDARERADAVADPSGGRVGIDRQHHDLTLGDVRGVDSSSRHHEAVPSRHDAGVTATGHDPHSLGVDGEFAVNVDDLTLGLRHNFRRDDEDVTVK